MAIIVRCECGKEFETGDENAGPPRAVLRVIAWWSCPSRSLPPGMNSPR